MTEAGLAMMFLRTLLIPVVMGAVLFASAGRLDLPAFWAYLAVLWLITGSVYTVLLRRDPALVAERLRPPSDRDRATRRLAFPFMGGHYVVAGLDAGRFGWTHAAPALHGAGFVLVVAGLSFACWTLLANPYASSAVRIQAERDQRVITTGPYRFVRHPMYSGVVLCSAGSGLALGSLWAGLLLVPVVAIFVRRTLLEDHMLMAELSGYADYARTVRARLIPGVF